MDDWTRRQRPRLVDTLSPRQIVVLVVTAIVIAAITLAVLAVATHGSGSFESLDNYVYLKSTSEAFEIDIPKIAGMAAVFIPQPVKPYFGRDPHLPLPLPHCVDGTDAQYYFRPSRTRDNRDKNLRWVIHLGGSNLVPAHMEWDQSLRRPAGPVQNDAELRDSRRVERKAGEMYNPGVFTCHDESTCKNRKGLVSSNHNPEYIYVDGILSDSPAWNPDFFDANHVFIPYCSADLWLGRSTVSNAVSQDHDLLFRGQDILDGVITDLLAHGLDGAREILISGSNEGGLGVVYHLDRLRELLPSAAYVMGLSDGGILFDHLTFDHKHLFEGFNMWGALPCPGSKAHENLDKFESVMAKPFGLGKSLINILTSLNITASDPEFDSYSCYIGWDYFAVLDTPIFLYMSQFNHFQLGSMGFNVRSTPTLSSADLISAFGRSAHNDLEALVKAKAEVLSRIEQGMHVYVQDGSVFADDSSPSPPNNADAQVGAVVATSGVPGDVAGGGAAAAPAQAQLDSSPPPADNAGDVVAGSGAAAAPAQAQLHSSPPPADTAGDVQVDAVVATSSAPGDAAKATAADAATTPDAATAAAAPAPAQAQPQAADSNKAKKSADPSSGLDTTHGYVYTEDTNTPWSHEYGQWGAHGPERTRYADLLEDDIDDLPVNGMQSSGSLSDETSYGIILDHLWRAPIPRATVQLGVFAPACRHIYGVLSQRAFTDNNDYKVTDVSFRQAFGSFYFGRRHQKPFTSAIRRHLSDLVEPSAGTSDSTSTKDKKKADERMSNGVFKAGSNGDVVTLYFEPLTNCSRCLVEFTSRAIEGLYSVPGLLTSPHNALHVAHRGQASSGRSPGTGRSKPSPTADSSQQHRGKQKKSAEEGSVDGPADNQQASNNRDYMSDASNVVPSNDRSREPGQRRQQRVQSRAASRAHSERRASRAPSERRASLEAGRKLKQTFKQKIESLNKQRPKDINSDEYKEWKMKMVRLRKDTAKEVAEAVQRSAEEHGQRFPSKKPERVQDTDAAYKLRRERFHSTNMAFHRGKASKRGANSTDSEVISDIARGLKGKLREERRKYKLGKEELRRQRIEKLREHGRSVANANLPEKYGQITAAVRDLTATNVLRQQRGQLKKINVDSNSEITSPKTLAQVPITDESKLAATLLIRKSRPTQVAGNTVEFCVENPLSLPMDINALRVVATAPDKSRRAVRPVPGASVDPTGLIIVKGNEQHLIVKSSVFCFGFTPTLAGVYMISVEVVPASEKLLGVPRISKPLKGSPFRIAVEPGEMSAARSRVKGMDAYRPSILSGIMADFGDREFRRLQQEIGPLKVERYHGKHGKGMSDSVVHDRKDHDKRRQFDHGNHGKSMGAGPMHSSKDHDERGRRTTLPIEDKAPDKVKKSADDENTMERGVTGKAHKKEHDEHVAHNIQGVTGKAHKKGQNMGMGSGSNAERRQTATTSSNSKPNARRRIDDSFVVSVVAFDQFGNAVSEGGDSVYIRFVGPLIVTPQIVDHLNGTYSAVVHLTEPGKYRADVLLLRTGESVSKKSHFSDRLHGGHIDASPYTLGVANRPKGTKSRSASMSSMSAHRPHHDEPSEAIAAAKVTDANKVAKSAEEHLPTTGGHRVAAGDMSKAAGPSNSKIGRHLFQLAKMERYQQYMKHIEKRESCSLRIARDKLKPLTKGTWMSKQLVSHRVGEWGTVINSTIHGNYRWTYGECVPAMVTPKACDDCLSDTWVHFIGDGTSRDLYRLVKALLVSSERSETIRSNSITQRIQSVAGPSLEWWQTQMAEKVMGSTKVIVSGYRGDSAAISMQRKLLWMYRYEAFNDAILTWTPFRDTKKLRAKKLDPITRIATHDDIPDVVVVGISTLKLCEMDQTKFTTYFSDYLKFVETTYKGRVVFLIPPAVHDSLYHERFRSCSYQKIHTNADVMMALLKNKHEYINLWEMTAGRPDATPDGSRYVWARRPEPMNDFSDGPGPSNKKYFGNQADGFVGPVGWSMANLLINRLCAGRLNDIYKSDIMMLTKSDVSIVFDGLDSGSAGQQTDWVAIAMIICAGLGIIILLVAAVGVWFVRDTRYSKRL